MARSLKTVREWGVLVLDAHKEAHLEGDLLMMASIEEIITAVKTALGWQ
jgi:hypothetical protein